jgi:hypothetical protein
MTGTVVRSVTTRIGTWRAICDGGDAEEHRRWEKMLRTPSEPAGTSVRVCARSADELSALGASSWMPVASGTSPDLAAAGPPSGLEWTAWQGYHGRGNRDSCSGTRLHIGGACDERKCSV